MTRLTGKLFLCFLIFIVLFTAGCGQDPEPNDRTAPSGTDFASNWDPALAEPARLIDVLPDSTVAYIRIPTLWGLLAAPKSSALAPALGSEANRDTVMLLQQRIPEVMEKEFGEFAPLMSLLFETLRSPLEIALVGEGPQPLEADLVIEARLALDSVDELNELLGRYAAPGSPFQQLEEAGPEQAGQLLVGMFPMFYQFDAQTQRVRMVGGMSAGIENFDQAQSWSDANATPLKEREASVDDSGHGLMIWADGTRLMPVLEQMAGREAVAELANLGVLNMEEFSLAYGSQNGKARLSLFGRGKDGPIWDFGLPSQGSSAIPIAGRADYVVGWVMPDYGWIDDTWRALSPDASRQIRELNGQAKEATGLSLADWANAFAGRWTLVGDDSGTVLVHEPMRPEVWSRLIEALGERFEVRQSEAQSQGQTVRHLVIPGMSAPELLPEAAGAQDLILRFVLERAMAVGTHVYWMEDDEGRRILTTVPQVLRDRTALRGGATVSGWLSQTGVEQESAALFGAIDVANAPRRNYYSYLSILQALGDMLDTTVDLHAFPSVHELNLADHGSVGVELRYSDGTLGMVFVFENHPGDILYSGAGGAGSIAMLAVLTAIAVPAYQDYVERARAMD